MQPVVRIAALLSAMQVLSMSAAFAQEPPKIQAGGGYMYIVDPWAAFNSPLTADAGAGWFAKVVGNVTPHIGAVGEVSASYYGAYGHRGIRGSARIYSVLGGMQFRPFSDAAVVPFAQAVAGTVHSRFRGEVATFSDATERHFAMAFGGGADIRGFHVATDLMRVRHHDTDSAWTWRVGAGVMLPGR